MKLSPPKNRYFAPTDNFKAGGDNFKGVAGTTFALPSSHQNGHPPTVREIVPPFLPYVILSPPHFFPQGGQFQGGRRGGQFHGGGSVDCFNFEKKKDHIGRRNNTQNNALSIEGGVGVRAVHADSELCGCVWEEHCAGLHGADGGRGLPDFVHYR